MIKRLEVTFLVLIADQLMLNQLLEDLMAATMFESSDGRHQIDRDYLVVLHPHLHLPQNHTSSILS